MAGCEFDRTFAGSADDVVARARNAIVANGGTLNGNAISGTFQIPTASGRIEALYTVPKARFISRLFASHSWFRAAPSLPESISTSQRARQSRRMLPRARIDRC
jgi:hypothetical protein